MVRTKRPFRLLPGAWALYLSWRGTLCAAVSMALLIGYAIVQNHPLEPSRLLPLTAFEQRLPLLPWTVAIYNTLALALIAAGLFAPDWARARRLFLSCGLVAAVCFFVFTFAPTHYPRALYPLPPDGGWATAWLSWVRGHDLPSSCLPSMHVALAWALALSVCEYGRGMRLFVLLWAAAVSVSTLTTKQHYLLDVAAGAALGVASWALCRWAGDGRRRAVWALGIEPIRLRAEEGPALLAKAQVRSGAAAWRVDDLDWAQVGGGAALSEDLVRFLSQVVYVEEIAADNFVLLARAATAPELSRTYQQFADEERRHADGLRRLLRVKGATLRPPGLGCGLLLHHFHLLDPKDDSDAVLVALAIPVFETFLDAGTIPFLRDHPALKSPAFDALIERICRDEASHLAVNWAVCREAARSVRAQGVRGLFGLRMLLNPAFLRGGLATPFLAIDVYAHAKRLGFDFRRLFPSFRRLFFLHRRHPELAGFPPWMAFRFWVLVAALVTWVVTLIEQVSPSLLGWLARRVTQLTDFCSKLTFDTKVLLGGRE